MQADLIAVRPDIEIMGNPLLERAGADNILVSSSEKAWARKSKALGDFLEARDIPVYVGEIHGDVRVEIKPSNYRIIPSAIPEGVAARATHSAAEVVT